MQKTAREQDPLGPKAFPRPFALGKPDTGLPHGLNTSSVDFMWRLMNRAVVSGPRSPPTFQTHVQPQKPATSTSKLRELFGSCRTISTTSIVFTRAVLPMEEKEISPPPTKRRKLSKSSSDSASPEITIYSWNVNGITPFVQRRIISYFHNNDASKAPAPATTTASLRSILRRHKWPTVFFLQEIKVNSADTATLKAIQSAVQRGDDDDQEPGYVAHFCLPSDKYNARGFGGKVYGVCSIIRRDFSDEWITGVRAVDWDKEGRVQVIETKGSASQPKLAIINLYAVNGTDNPYKDSDSGKVVGTRHDRKIQVHDLLAAECRKLEASGFTVVIAGDVNIARAAIDGHPNLRTFPRQHCVNRAHFEATFFAPALEGQPSEEHASIQSGDMVRGEGGKGLDMIDTFRHLHPSRKAYTYYPRNKPFGQSCDRVDMILISRSLQDHLREAGMHETPGDRGPSDHVPLYAKLCFESGMHSHEAAG